MRFRFVRRLAAPTNILQTQMMKCTLGETQKMQRNGAPRSGNTRLMKADIHMHERRTEQMILGKRIQCFSWQAHLDEQSKVGSADGTFTFRAQVGCGPLSSNPPWRSTKNFTDEANAHNFSGICWQGKMFICGSKAASL